MKRRKPPRERPTGLEVALEDSSGAVAQLIELAERHGCHSITAHTASGVWRVSVTKLSGGREAPAGNYQRPSWPRR